eukprot:scaffold130590_cov36-Phaeocystis_antarctica.AAC.1
MTCLGSSGTGMPQAKVVRETERSRRGSLRRRSRISLRRDVGWMNSGCASMCAWEVAAGGIGDWAEGRAAATSLWAHAPRPRQPPSGAHAARALGSGPEEGPP